MLTKLTIKNVALIDNTQIEFDKGLNILSGETGSGKSVIIDSLNFVLGAKADKTLITHGQEFCQVIAEFFVGGNENIQELFDEFDMERDEILVVSRKFTIDGKNSLKVNGNTMPVSMLKKFTAYLVDVHGQSEHFYLLKESNQLSLLDKFSCVDELKKDILSVHNEYNKILNEIDSLGGDESSRAIRIDVLSYQIKEIEQASIYDGEEEELVQKRKKLINQEKIINGLNTSHDALNGDGGVLDVLQNALHSLGQIAGLDEKYNEIYSLLDSAKCEIDDVCDRISSEIYNFEDEGESLEVIEERLEVIKKIKKKYGTTFEEIDTFYQNALAELEKLNGYDELYQNLLDKKSDFEKTLYKKYLDLSNARKTAAKVFSDKIVIELSELGMEKATFSVDFNEFPSIKDTDFSLLGQDKVEFMFSANLGEPKKPLSKIISGGEISRFMLAVKTVASEYQSISTFVFDEIDAGISGKIAEVVAKKFAKIAKNTCVIAISHLPQICAMSDVSFLIYKQEVDGRTKSFVQKLDEEQKLTEILRLVGGKEDSEVSLMHAKSIIQNANEYKKGI